jgi:hypothetical protein
MSDTPKDSAVFTLVLMLAGGGLGIFATIQALTSDSYEGPVYIFLPTIILGFLGMMIGYAIDTGINKARGVVKTASAARTRPTVSESSAQQLTKLADLLERGLISPAQFDAERDRVLGSSKTGS